MPSPSNPTSDSIVYRSNGSTLRNLLFLFILIAQQQPALSQRRVISFGQRLPIIYRAGESQQQNTWMRHASIQLQNGYDPNRILLGLSKSYTNIDLDEGEYHQAISCVSRLMDRGANVNAQDIDGNSVLLNFVIGFLNLLDDSVNYNEQRYDDSSDSALERATIFENVIKLLLNNGAHIYLANNRGISPVDIARNGFQGSQESVALRPNPTLLRLLVSTAPIERAYINVTQITGDYINRLNESDSGSDSESADSGSDSQSAARRLSFS